MARPKRQEQRRGEIIRAAQRVIARHGMGGAQLVRIAAEAGITSGTVLYYYPDVEELLLQASQAAMERFSEQRARMLEALPDDPPLRLAALIDAGLPTGPDDIEVQLLSELGGSAARTPLIATLLTTLYDRQVGMYQVVLEQGAARGDFTLTRKTLALARNLVALEDAYGYRIVARHPTIDHTAARELILDAARAATGHPLDVLP